MKKKADTLWSRATRYRFMENDGSIVCVTCGAVKDFKSIQCGHFMSRRFNETRFSEENTAPQCYQCNVTFQGEQFKFAQFIDGFYGEGTAERLQEEARRPHQFTIKELEDIINDCKEQIAFYEKV